MILVKKKNLVLKMQFQFLKICFRIISYYFFIRKIFNKTDIFEVFWREKKKYISLSAALRIFKSSQLMSSVHVYRTLVTLFFAFHAQSVETFKD